MAHTYDFWMFDLDGTIVDIEPSYPTAVVTDVGDRLGVGFTEREAEILWYGLGGVREHVLQRHGIAPDLFWEVFHEPVLDRLDIRDWFDTVVCCSEETGWKPDPTPVEMAMTDLDVAHNGHEGVLVGDDPDDVGAAWNAGLDAIHVERYDPDERGQCVLGDHRVRGFDDLV